MNIKFIKAVRVSDNVVNVTYSVSDTIRSLEFSVEWNNIHAGTGEVGSYELQDNAKSSNKKLAILVNDAIRLGESDCNDDLEVYLAIRDLFNNNDCENVPYKFNLSRKG